MKSFTVFQIVASACLIVAGIARGEPENTPIYSNEPTGQYFRNWLLCGPFPSLVGGDTNANAIRRSGMYTDFLKSHGGEAAPNVAVGQVESSEGGSCTWVRYASPDDTVDLAAAISPAANVAAYAYCEIESAKAQPCVLALGTNDGVRVWLNGENVWERPGPRGLKPDGDLIPVGLKQGRNTLLLKIDQYGNRWQLTCRLLPLNDPSLAQRFDLFGVVMDPNGTPVLRLKLSEGLLGALIQNAKLEVAAADAPDKIVWSGDWNLKKDMPIPVDTKFFGEYVMRIAAILAGGAEQAMEIPFAAGKRIENTLFSDGKTDYAIIVGGNALESEKWAAQELQHWLKEVSGANFALKDDAGPAPAKAIVVGVNKHSGQLLGLPQEKYFERPISEDDAFTYLSIGPNIVIHGGGQRGTMYGVMSFLERELGVRFYTPKVTVAPKKQRYSFVYLNHSEKPGMRVRNDFYFEAFDPIWAAHNRINGAMTWREQPGGLEAYWSVHTFYPLMPPAEFFDSHPEYYSLLNGKRTAEQAQLCLTNPDVLRIMTERITKVMRENPQYLIYDVSQNDWSNPCQCDKCQAIVDKEGSQSGPVIWFVNQVADNVKKEFPDKFIGTLAYSYTRKPPKTEKPHDNVVVRFCSIECCFAHPFTECPENKSFVEDMNGWAAVAPHIYIWDYVVNFSHYIMPYPNFRVLQPNINFFRTHNAIGIMEQAAYQSRGGEFAELRAYVIAKLLWNPDCNVNDVINDFLYGYYGRAGQYVRAYFDALHGRLTPDTHIHLGLQPDDALFTDTFVREAEALFNKAETVADSEEVRQRVEMARLPIMYLKCKRLPALAKEDGTYARFNEIVKRENVTYFAEAGEPHAEAFREEVEAAQ
jgi:hypothetical protein